ncbi:MAG: hypothetical protein M1833_003691 [Piccolia ochrophora]|nr:MAG: hypothetical protein M1833_003691 [Piccolia ochrophora]
MPTKEAVTTDKAHGLPLFSQAIKCDGFIYCSGQVGFDPATKELREGDVGDRTAQSLRNLSAVLEAAGSKLNNAVKVQVFLTTMDNFAAMNRVYETFFSHPLPVSASLPVS